MFNMCILAKYAVILRVVGMNCNRDGAPTFKKSAQIQSKSHRSAHIL